MLASELIEQLQSLIKRHGDLPVEHSCPEAGWAAFNWALVADCDYFHNTYRDGTELHVFRLV